MGSGVVRIDLLCFLAGYCTLNQALSVLSLSLNKHLCVCVSTDDYPQQTPSVTDGRTVSVCLSVCASVCLCVYLSVCLCILVYMCLQTTILNKHLQALMDGLTAKVFRTYNASHTLQQQLDLLTQQGTFTAIYVRLSKVH